MKSFLLRLFTWWNGQTFGTQLWTWRYGEFVGEDEFGNRYYRTRDGKIDPALCLERRWVIYNGYAESSTVPPSWHGWLHHTVDVPPTVRILPALALAKAAPAESDRHCRAPIDLPDRRWRVAAGRARPATTGPGIRTPDDWSAIRRCWTGISPSVDLMALTPVWLALRRSLRTVLLQHAVDAGGHIPGLPRGTFGVVQHVEGLVAARHRRSARHGGGTGHVNQRCGDDQRHGEKI